MSASIFISHASEDRKIAHTLCDALESRGFKCWIASRDIGAGENFQIAIVRAIRNARVMLLVFTANSNSSEEMSKELALASQHKLIVLPLRVEDVAPNDAFAYEFSTRQWIDFFADWEWAINQLCIRLANAMKAEDDEAAAAALAASPPPPIAATADSAAGAGAEAAATAKAAPAAKPVPVETLKMPAAAAAAAAAATATAAKPAPVKPIPAKPVAAEKPVIKDGAEPEAKKSRVGLLAAAAAALIVVIGIGLAVPTLMGKKSGAQASIGPQIKPSSASSAAPAAQATPSIAATAESSGATADSSAAAQLAANGDATDSSAAPAPKVHTHHARAAAVHVATSRADLPY